MFILLIPAPNYPTNIHGQITVLTIMWDYSPGHSRCIYSPNHPEHAEPTEVFTALLLGQKFRVVGKHDGNRTTNPAKIRNQQIPESNCCLQRFIKFRYQVRSNW